MAFYVLKSSDKYFLINIYFCSSVFISCSFFSEVEMLKENVLKVLFLGAIAIAIALVAGDLLESVSTTMTQALGFLQ